jgi:adenine-specific DNA-methyltransferase
MPSTPSEKKDIEQYQHKGKLRCNNPPVGLVTPDTDKDEKEKTYQYDPHLDPQLVWAGKAEHTSFTVPTVSLHVHERIDPRTIIEAARKKSTGTKQASLFEFSDENPPMSQAIEFYKHRHNWSNRLVAGDSLLVMNSLLEKEGMAGKVQMIYIDPPYGIKYGSNFQPFVNKRDVKDGKDEDLTQEPEMVKAFRDTWELGIHSYLTYLLDRLLLAKELLTESGSCFVQISDENIHHVKELMDEIFGRDNFVSIIAYATTGGFASATLSRLGDYILWFSKDKKSLKYRQLYLEKSSSTLKSGDYRYIELPNGKRILMSSRQREGFEPLPESSRIFRVDNTTSQGSSTTPQPFEFESKIYNPPHGSHWKANWPEGMNRLKDKKRLLAREGSLAYIRYLDDFPVIEITNMWGDTSIAGIKDGKRYVVQTNPKVIERCMLMTTDPGDLVLDPTCGSGTTTFVAEQWGRRWITCDTSRVAITIAKQRLMTTVLDYYELSYPEEGVGSGFRYKTVPHITLKSIANNEPPAQETLFDQPFVDNKKVRVTGPFTVEAVPSPTVLPVSEYELPKTSEDSIARAGETLRQAEWRSELLRTGIRGRGGQKINFSRVEPLAGTRWLHADAETNETSPQRVVVAFGPEHAPMDKKQVESAVIEAQKLVPKPKMVAFAAFQFDPEAAREVEETKWPGVTLINVQMNADLLTEDLKKKRASNESFWMVGQPDVTLEKVKDGDEKGKYIIEVHGFDYYDTRTENVESGGVDKIAMWMLDTDYDGRSIFPRQVFFPMAGEKDGWARLAKNLKAEIDEERIEQFKGTKSLPFIKGPNGRIAVKIVDDRGIECLRIMNLE